MFSYGPFLAHFRKYWPTLVQSTALSMYYLPQRTSLLWTIRWITSSCPSWLYGGTFYSCSLLFMWTCSMSENIKRWDFSASFNSAGQPCACIEILASKIQAWLLWKYLSSQCSQLGILQNIFTYVVTSIQEH